MNHSTTKLKVYAQAAVLYAADSGVVGDWLVV